ncbi:unnamed protein product, partial [Symbiodinium sp. CCMP2456]
SLAGGIGELFTHAESASGVSDNLDLFAAARGAAEQVSRSGVQSALSAGLSAGGMRDLFAPVRVIPPEDSEPGSDLLAAAHSAADAVSSGAASSAVSVRGHLGDLFVPNKVSGQVKEPVAPPKPSEGSESGSDLFGLAKGVAAEVSKSGVESVSAGRGGVRDLFAPVRVTAAPAEDSEAGSDLLAAARTAADAVSSGVASSAVSAANGRLGDLFAPSQASRGKAPAVPPKPSEGSESGSDLLGFAKGAAAEVSRSGVQSATSGPGGGHHAARRRLGGLVWSRQQCSLRGERSPWRPLRPQPGHVSKASVRRGRDVEAAPPRRRDVEAAGQHQSAPPKHQPPWAQALDDGADTQSARARGALPPVPSPPRLRAQPPQPPDPPPLPNRTFLTDPNEGDAASESGELVMARASACCECHVTADQTSPDPKHMRRSLHYPPPAICRPKFWQTKGWGTCKNLIVYLV